ncbi:MAG: hypothetical protein ACOVRN_10855 [Flavobacterium sp.]
MSGFIPIKRRVVTGITSKQTTHTPQHKLGSGAFKEVVMAQPAEANDEEFSFAELAKVGGPKYADYYAIVAVADFSASRLLSELTLQFGFAKIGLSPNIYALKIDNYMPHYGEGNIIAELKRLTESSTDGDECDFLIAMERVNYNMGSSGSAITPEEVINADPNKLIHLINAVLAQEVILADIKVKNLSVKCSSSWSCELGVIDLDGKFVADVTGWRFLSMFTGTIDKTLAGQYMVLMVCFVGLNNGLRPDTKKKLLRMVGLADFTETGDIKWFDSAALNRMLQYEGLKKQIKHYLGFNHDRTRDIGQGFNDEYIKGELLGAVDKSDSTSTSSGYQRPIPDTPMSDSSLVGGKSRRKHKKTRKRKPKSRKTRRKRSLLNRTKVWDR